MSSASCNQFQPKLKCEPSQFRDFTLNSIGLTANRFFSFSRMGVQIPGAWQGVPAQAQIPTAQIPTAQGVGSALPQAAGVVAYPMQQFQVSPQVHTTNSYSQ